MNFFKIKRSKVKIIDDNDVYSYQNIFNEHNKLKKLNLEHGLVMLISSNSYETLLFYSFFFNEKYPQIIIDDKTSERKTFEIIERYKPKYIILDKKEYINKFWEIKLRLNNFFFRKTNYKNFKLNKSIALLLSTSGTTGSQKFVKLSYKNIKDNTNNIIKYLKINNKDSCITTMPFAYSYGLSVINTHLKKNCSIILTEKSIFDKIFWERYNLYKVTNLNGVPIFFELLKKLGMQRIINQNLRFITQAGGKMEEELANLMIKFCNDNHIKLITMYGQTEASPRISYLKSKFLKSKFPSIGKPIPGGKIKIIKNEIVYYGNNIFGGYSSNIQDLKIFKNNKSLKTGDIGYVDKDGFVYITGRKKRIVKINGYRLSLDEIQNNIFNDLNIKIACVETDNKLKIFFINIQDKESISKYLKKNLLISDKFFKLIIIQNFPLSLNKKINYKELIKI